MSNRSAIAFLDEALAGPEAQPVLGPDPLVAAADVEMSAAAAAPVPKSASAMLADVPEPSAEPRSAAALLADITDGQDSGTAEKAPPAANVEQAPLKFSFAGAEKSLAESAMGDPKPEEPKVEFTGKDDPWRFTGAMVADAQTGQVRPTDGKIVFDTSSPERFTAGIEGAWKAELMSGEQYAKIKESAASVYKAVDDRRKLEQKAQQDPRLLAALQGTGRGGAATLGAIGGAKALGAAGLAAGPWAEVAVPVLGTVGAIGGGIMGAVGYDALYKQLAKHIEEYDTVLKSAELYPEYKAGGELSMAAVALPVSVAQGARGLTTAYQAGGLQQAGKLAAGAMGAGAATGAVAYPINAAVEGEPVTPGGFAAATGAGALAGGFFVNNRTAGAAELAQVASKIKAGTPLTAAESEMARSGGPAIRAAIAEMEAAGGVRTGPVDVEVPMTSVAGFMSSAGKATARVPYSIPEKLPDGSMQRAREVAQRRLVETTGAADAPVPEVQPAIVTRRTTAPVNVLPTGKDPIATTPPMTPAMMSPDVWIQTIGQERGIDLDFNPEAETELMREHFEVVRDAVNSNQPVNADALDIYEMRVPYYVRDEVTGLAIFDEPTFTAWGEYVQNQEKEVEDEAKRDGVELLDAIRQLGGLPSPKSGDQKAVWAGELKWLWETSRGGRDIGLKGAMNLFRNDAPDLDDLVQGLKQRGFRLDTEADLLEMLDNRLRSGREVFGYPVAAEEAPMPMGARMGRAPRQLDLLGEADVEFQLVGQTDAKSLTPAELAAKAQAEADAAAAEKAQGDLFGAPRRGAGPRRPTKDLLGREISAEQLAFNEQFLLSGVVDPSLTTAYATDFPNMAAAFAEQQQAIGGPSYGQTGRGVVRVYPRQGARETTVNEFTLPKGAQPVAEFTPAQIRAGEHLKWFAQQQTAGPASPTGARRGAAAPPPGGPAWVPPGVARPADTTTPRPDWVLRPGETSEGRRLIKGIANFKRGQRWGFRAIVDHVNRAVRMEMRRSKSQTSKVHPAHYKPAHHMAYTRDTQSQVNFHEAGHGLEYLVRARDPKFFDAHATELVGLTQRPGSMASDPPSSAPPAQKEQYKIGEGVAEWTRLLMTDPAAVQNLKVTAALSAIAERYYPGVAAALRDGARAVHAFQQKPVAERWAMFNAQPNLKPNASETIGGLIRMGEGAINSMSSGAPVSKLDRTIRRAILKDRKEVGMTRDAAIRKMREVEKKNLTPLLSAYNMILSIGSETQQAISGQGSGKGLRAVGPDGKFQWFTKDTWRDLRRKVPARNLAQFDDAAWALESLNRWKAARMEYPGMREGVTPQDLEAIVVSARRDIKDFDNLFTDQSAFHEAVLDLKDFGRLLKPGERDRIVGKRDTYWPLPRVMQEGRGRAGKGGGDVKTGLYRARGSGEAIRQIDEVTEERVRTAFEAYYWNRFGLQLVQSMQRVATDKSLPIAARSIAGSTVVKLNMPMKSVAAVSADEVKPWVISAVAEMMEPLLGFRPDLTPDDINLSWNFKDVWRPARPDDVNVVSLLRDGQREYYQLGDPAMFGMFANPQVASKAGRFLSWATGPMTQNWKRSITQGPVFAVRNLFRDVFTQTILNPDPIAWIPGWTHMLGVINKWTQKYPQVFSEGLLLSRVEPSETELVNAIRHGAIWQWITEGFYVSQAKDPVVKLLATVLQPSNWLFPLWKLADVVNTVTGGRTLAAFFETAGREGAAVSALKRGGTDEEALMKYWTAAGQFNEHPGIADARIVMNIPGFLNPMFQGTRNAMQKLSDPDPGVRGTAWARLLVMMPMAFGGAAVASYLMMGRKDRDRERQRPVEDRMNFMDVGGFSVPFPYGPEGVMASVVYNAVMDYLLNREMKDADKTAWMLLRRIGDVGSPLQFFGPQLSSVFEAGMNWSNYRQRNIVAPWMVNLPASEQYYSTTPAFYQKLGQMFNYSPAKLQYIVQQGISRQADETVRFLENIDGGRPIQEPADVPFVGRLFVRDPIGFGSQSVRDADNVDAKLREVSARLNAKGWGMLGAFDRNGNPEYPPEKLGAEELKNLQAQLQYLQGLRRGLRQLDDLAAIGKAYALAGDFSNERNVRRLQTVATQNLLIGNRDEIQMIDRTIDLLRSVAPAPPKQRAADYLDRRF